MQSQFREPSYKILSSALPHPPVSNSTQHNDTQNADRITENSITALNTMTVGLMAHNSGFVQNRTHRGNIWYNGIWHNDSQHYNTQNTDSQHKKVRITISSIKTLSLTSQNTGFVHYGTHPKDTVLMIFGIMTLSNTSHRILTLSMTKISIRSFNITKVSLVVQNIDFVQYGIQYSNTGLMIFWHNDSQHNITQNTDNQHNRNQYNNTQHNDSRSNGTE